jgi:hypothetical protein
MQYMQLGRCQDNPSLAHFLGLYLIIHCSLKRSSQPDSSPMALQDELCKNCISKHQGQQIFPQNPNCHKKHILPFLPLFLLLEKK